MLVSILLTNYNYGDYLEDAIKSLTKQNYPDMEVIIVDDGSHDNSKQVIRELNYLYKDYFLRFESIFIKENQGKLHALNVAIPYLKGEVTIILDADDYLTCNYIRTSVEALLCESQKNPKVAFTYTDCHLINDDNKVIGHGKSTAFDQSLLTHESYIPECGPTLTKALKDAWPFEETIRVGTKHHKWLKIVNNGWQGYYVPQPLFYYRMHQNNLSGIGKKILGEVEKDKADAKILSGYWEVPESSPLPVGKVGKG